MLVKGRIPALPGDDSDYSEVRDYLYSLKGKVIKLDLANMVAFLNHLDNPQLDYRTLHVAGTNGKGSVGALLSSTMWRAGERWGLNTSPHLVDITERIRVDDVSITERDFVDAFRQVLPYVDEHQGMDCLPSFFEIVTAMAMLHFSKRSVDGAVFEVGLGGRLDATNLIQPDVSVITGIGLDHTKTLGGTHAKIAGEKAGIIKPGIPVVCGPMPASARRVIDRRAREMGSESVTASDVIRARAVGRGVDGTLVRVESPWGALDLRYPLVGDHQLWNLETALATLSMMPDWKRRVKAEAVSEGVELVSWRGRFERRGRYIMDGAHNRDGAAAMTRTVESLGLAPVSMVVGILARKDHASILRHFSRVAGDVVFTKTSLDEGVSPEELARAFRGICGDDGRGRSGFSVRHTEDVASAMRLAARMKPPVLVSGSLYTIGEAMAVAGMPKPLITPSRLFTELREGVDRGAFPGGPGKPRTPFQVLISTILSQRTRDANTEVASELLFSEASTPKAVLALPHDRLESLIRPAGFYRQKAKAIRAVCEALLALHGGEVPRTLEGLVALPGVGPKTANCVLVYAYGEDALPVDTHVHRISNWLGLVSTRTPEETEAALKGVLPRGMWKEINGLMVRFGQTVCTPVGPRCRACRLRDFCQRGDTWGGRS